MRLALASAPAVEPPASQLAAYAGYLARAGHGNPAYQQAPQAIERLTDGRRRRRTAMAGGERPSRGVAHHGVYRREAP